MKTKSTVIPALCLLALAASCQKETGTSDPVAVPVPDRITAYIDNSDTKTSYTDETRFSWVKDDRILLVVTNASSGAADHYSQWALDSGVTVDFQGTDPSASSSWNATGYALYPVLTHGGTASEGLTVTLPSSYEVTGDNFMNIIPLVGKAEEGNASRYRFRTAVGVLKVTMANLPSTARSLALNTTVPVCGVFPLDDAAAQEGFMMSDASSAGNSVAVCFPSQSGGSSLTVYLPVPVGTIPAGATFSILNEAGTALFTTAPTTKAITVVRNQLLDITPVNPITFVMPDVDLDDLLGEYEMIDYGQGAYSTNYTPGDIVLEASDDASLGNVMMTKFAGVSGRQYGTFDGEYLVFPKDQLFADNPYDDADDKPYIAIDFYKGSVVDATFQLVEKGKIRAVNADAMGFRSCTEADWLENNHGGGWPWVLCFNAIVARWKSLAGSGSYSKGEEIPLRQNMIYACNSITWDGQGVAGLIDGDPSTFWHSDYYYAIANNDTQYGIYFDITLDSEIDAFRFKYQVRANNANSKPTSIVYGVSSDGATWTYAGEDATEEMAAAAAGDWVELSSISLKDPCKYIRFGIADSSDTGTGSLTGDLNWEGYKKCVNMAELKLFWPE